MKTTLWVSAVVGVLGLAGAANAGSVVDDCCGEIVEGPDSLTIEFQGSQHFTEFFIEYLGEEDNTFTYLVTHETGHGLSHFNFLLEDCLEFVIDTSGPGTAEFGYDGSTGTTGLKFDELQEQQVYEFSFTLSPDANWTLGTIDVLAKASNAYGIGGIAGPQCCGITVVPTPAAAGMGLVLLGLGALRRSRRTLV